MSQARDAEFMASTMTAMTRKEANDARLLERVEQARLRARQIKLASVWLMTAAIGSRMKAWTDTFRYVRACKADFRLWVAAAITIQRTFRKRSRGMIREMRELASLTITRYFRFWGFKLHIWRKGEAQKIIAGFLRNGAEKQMSMRFRINLFRYKVVRIQRFWRNANTFLKRIYNHLFEVWEPMEAEMRDRLYSKAKKAISASTKPGKDGGKSQPPSGKPPAKAGPIPFAVKYKIVRDEVHRLKANFVKAKKTWANDFKDWQTRERYRRSVINFKRHQAHQLEHQHHYPEDLSNGDDADMLHHGDAFHDDSEDIPLPYIEVINVHLDQADPPPRFPVFSPEPTRQHLKSLVLTAFDKIIPGGVPGFQQGGASISRSESSETTGGHGSPITRALSSELAGEPGNRANKATVAKKKKGAR